MKSLLARIALHKAVGLYLGEHEVAVSKVAATPLGSVEVVSSSEPYTPENLPAVIQRLVVPLLGHKRRVPVAVGLASSRFFFGTRLAGPGTAPTPESVLQKALCSSNICVEDLTADLLRSEVNKLPVTSVAACRKKYITGIVATLSGLGIRPLRAEPSPCALVRLAASQYQAPRRSKTLLRVFLGASQGLAVMVAGDLPLAWRTFTLPAHMEGFAILSAARALRTQERHYGIESSLDYAIVHGRADLHEGLQKEQFATEMGTRVLWHDRPALDGKSTAYGLATGCLTPNLKAFDLSQSLKSRPSIWEIFPWWDLAFTAILVVIMALVLGARSMKLDESYTELNVQISQHKCLASGGPQELQKVKKGLEEKINAVRRFLASRILWSVYLHDLSVGLPISVVLSGLEGKGPLDDGGRSVGKKSFALRAMAPLAQDGGTPREIDAFLSTLHNHPLFKRDFGSAELTGISRSGNMRGAAPMAIFAINCVPNAPVFSPIVKAPEPAKPAMTRKPAMPRKPAKTGQTAKKEAQ